MDGSLVDADASKNSVIKGPPELIAQLKKILSMILRQILINVRRGRDLGGGNICQLEKPLNFPGG